MPSEPRRPRIFDAPRPRRPARAIATGLVILLACSCSLSCSAAGGSPTETITVGANDCAKGWKAPTTGTDTFQVQSRSPLTVDVQLLATGGQIAYAEIPTLGPGTKRPLTVTLGPGTYTWQCASLAGAIYSSDPERVTGPAVHATAGYVPVRPDDLTAAVDAYRDQVGAGLATLAADTDRLLGDVDAGNTTAAKSQWLVAHLDYARLGAAYGTFGDFDGEIDGRADGLPGGVHDKGFTGFLRLEYGLWGSQADPARAAVAHQLDDDVHALVTAFPHQLTLSTDIALRAHEILENALQFELTGDTDEGSGTNLATMRANVDATSTVLDAITPLLRQRNPGLVAGVEKGLGQLSTMLDGYRHTDGTWAPVEALAPQQREQLDGATSQILEQLSLIPGTLRLFAVGAD